MIIKAIVVDIDGTITYKDRSLDYAAVEILRTLEVPVGLATGNNLCFAQAAFKLIGVCDIIIAENGGIVEYNKDIHILGDIKECENAFKVLKNYFDLERLDSDFRKTEIALSRNFDVKEASNILKNYNFKVDLVDSGFAIHIKNKKVNKGVGLKYLAKLMNLNTKEFAAIGDSVNDIELLKESGFGIAVGNARYELKNVADLVTEEYYGKGVVEGIKSLRLKG
ncbi:MAG: phosphoglycolate phosphatase, partial [Methanosarcinales archaeon]